jgi:hypothetical protein
LLEKSAGCEYKENFFHESTLHQNVTRLSDNWKLTLIQAAIVNASSNETEPTKCELE